MNICIINTDSNPNWIGGIKRVAYILGNEWKKKGHNVMFLSFCISPDKYADVYGIPQYFFPDDKSFQDITSDINFEFFVKFVATHNIDIILNPFCDTSAMVDLCSKVRANISSVRLVTALHFAVTHRLDITAQSFFTKFKTKYSLKEYLIDGLLWLKFQTYSKHKILREDRALFHMAYQSSDLMVLLSSKFIADFQRIVKLPINPTKLIAINNPILPITDSSTFRKEKLVIWCGRNEYGHKRLDRMLKIWQRVWKRNPDWQLLILGGGDHKRFETICNKRGIKNITFAGFQQPDNFYDRASILCMTSASEGWGMVLVEAQSYGCVPIAYESFASLSDIINDGKNGFIIPPFNEHKYIKRLETLMNDSAMCSLMGNEAKNSVSRFYANEIATTWLKEFEKLKSNSTK